MGGEGDEVLKHGCSVISFRRFVSSAYVVVG